MASGTSAGRFRLLGLIALAIGVIGGVTLWLIAAKRYDDAVETLAPAPSGCDTTLVFDRTGTYTFFLESVGTIGEIDGDCENDDRSYDLGEDAPPVDLNLVADDGRELDLDRADGPSYDRAGAVGRGVRTAEIDADGEYVLSVASEADDVVIRVGRDPSNGVVPLRIGAVAVLVAGIVLAILAVVRGRAQWTIPAERSPADGPWRPHEARPVAPPYANPPSPPPYGRPGSGGPLPPPRPPG